jgi:hypothetical protein
MEEGWVRHRWGAMYSIHHPCTPNCLEDVFRWVKTSSLSRRDWVLHDSRILVSVTMFGPHVVRRVFHIPPVIVQVIILVAGGLES